MTLPLLLVLLGPTAAQAAAPAAPPCVVAEYRFETLENRAVPETAGRWPGRAEGEVGLAPGKSGQALALGGKGHVVVPGSEKLAFVKGLSIEAWVRPERLVAGRIVDRSTPGSSDDFCLDTHPGDAVRFITPGGTLSAPKALETGRWTHVIAVCDPDASELAIYLDGRLAAASQAGRIAGFGAKHPMRIGADTEGNNRFAGLVDEVRLYDVPLLNADAAARFEGKPIAWGRFPTCQNEPLQIHYRDGLQADHAALLGRNDVVYLSPAVHEHEALPLGNGRLCAMVWNNGGLDMQLSHAGNVWHQTASGRVHVRAMPALLDSAESFSQRLSLYDGTVRTRCRGKAGEWTATTTVLDGLDVVAIRLEGTLRSESLAVELEQWRPGAAAVSAADAAGFVEDLPAPAAPQFSRKMAFLARADCPAVVAPVRQEGDARRTGLVLSPKRAADGAFACTIYVANPVVSADADPRAAASALLGEALRQGWPALAARSAQRWASFWEKSLVYLTSPDGVADYMENLWRLHLYWMGCAGEGDLAVKFNGGAFLAHRDSRSWGTSYWYQNTRELYWALPAANHLELCRGLQRLYLGNLPAHRTLARELFGKKGLQVEETMAITGQGDKRGNPYTMLYLSTGLECAWQLFHQAAFARDDAMLRDEVLPFMKEAVDFYMDYATLGPDGRFHIRPEDARETYWRVEDGMASLAALRAAIPLLAGECQRLGLYAEMQPKWKDFLDRLAPLPERLEGTAYAACVVPAEVPASDNPTVNRLYTPDRTTTAYDKRFNSENVELDVVYPFGLAGIGTANRDKAVKAYEDRPFKGSYGWDWSPVCVARLGLGDEAARIVAEHCRNCQHWPQGFYDSPSSPYWAGGMVDCPYFDSSGVNAAATTEMLMQSHGGIVRVWPAVPAAWSGAFRLRAETGFMVSSERTAGEIRYVAVESLFGGPCRVANPWADAFRVRRGSPDPVRRGSPDPVRRGSPDPVRRGSPDPVRRGSPDRAASSSEGLQSSPLVCEGRGAEIAFDTAKGAVYLIERAAAPVSSMPFARLAPPPNEDVKYMANPRRARRPFSPAPGLPMLGITRDGLTAPRVAAAQNRARAAETIRSAAGDRKPLQGVTGQWLDAQGKASPAPWLCDGVFGAGTIPLPRVPAAAYELQLPAAVEVAAVAWSFDRHGGRYDAGVQAKQVVVEVSADGRAWQKAAELALPANELHGKAVSLTPPKPARCLRIRFLDAGANPVPFACDEIEVY